LIELVATSERLRVNEIFHSLQGEADAVGYPTVFVRLTGCPLRCQYCDTEYAFHDGRWLDLDAIIEQVRAFGTQHGFTVSLETSGAMDISGLDARVARVVDVKTPGSREAQRNRIDNFALLTQHDQLKFVICSREDFDWSKAFIHEHALSGRCQILFSPSYKQIAPAQLADWILAERLPVRFQLQLHKILWGDIPGK